MDFTSVVFHWLKRVPAKLPGVSGGAILLWGRKTDNWSCLETSANASTPALPGSPRHPPCLQGPCHGLQQPAEEVWWPGEGVFHCPGSVAHPKPQHLKFTATFAWRPRPDRPLQPMSEWGGAGDGVLWGIRLERAREHSGASPPGSGPHPIPSFKRN